jgi:uncharacterized damage-inducible protein DinB
MTTSNLPEYWLRGPVPGIAPLLQPVAHALLQAKEEVSQLMNDFPENLLWEKPAGMASPAFHLQHLQGVLDRLFTYASGHSLTDDQLAQLRQEGKPYAVTTQKLLMDFQQQVDTALESMKQVKEETLTEARSVGRAKLPSTVMGLIFHAAEHTMRHTGQLLVTVNVLTKQ